MYAGSGTASKQYYHADAQGSVIAISDTTGAAVETHSYDPYGVSTDTGSGNPFRYTGRRLDHETGLYYYRARYYSPTLGRFLQTDPIGYGDGLNLYAYVGNDPLNNTDPSGEFGIVGAIVGAGLDLGLQLYDNGGNLSEVDFGSVATSAAIGALGGIGTSLIKGGIVGTIKLGSSAVKLVTKSQRAVSAASGIQKAGVAGAAAELKRGKKHPIAGAAEKIANGVTSPVPSGTIIRKGLEMVDRQQSANQSESRLRQPQSEPNDSCDKLKECK